MLEYLTIKVISLHSVCHFNLFSASLFVTNLYEPADDMYWECDETNASIRY